MASYEDEHDISSNTEGRIDDHILFEIIRNLHRALPEDTRAPPASKQFISNLKTVDHPTGNCPVCLAEFENEVISKQLPCNHCFHARCITAWLEKTNSCPVCRREFPTDNAEYEARKLEKEKEAEKAKIIEELHNSMFS